MTLIPWRKGQYQIRPVLKEQTGPTRHWKHAAGTEKNDDPAFVSTCFFCHYRLLRTCGVGGEKERSAWTIRGRLSWRPVLFRPEARP